MNILRLFCMFREQYQVSSYVSFSAELKGDSDIKLMRLNENFTGFGLNYEFVLCFFI